MSYLIPAILLACFLVVAVYPPVLGPVVEWVMV